MKKHFRFFVTFLVFSCWLPHVTNAQDALLEEVIPDRNLELAVREALSPDPETFLNAQDLVRLTNLDASNRQIMNLTGLERAVNLRELNLSHNQIQDITPLAGLTNLEELNLGNWQTEGGINRIADLTPLSRLTNLKILSLFSANIRNKDLTPLAQLTQLTLLSLDYNNLNDVGPLSGLINLEFLYLGGNQITDLSPLYALLRQNPDVKIYLEGDRNHIAIFGVKPLQLPPDQSTAPSLIPDPNLAAAVREELGLAPNASITRQALQRLTALDGEGVGVEDVGDLTGLQHATQLTKLTLLNHNNPNLTPLTGLTNLTVLNLIGHEISDITPLASLKNLTKLSILGGKINDFTPLTSLKSLTSLDLLDVPIDNRDLIVIAKLTNLTSLDLRFNTISDVSPLANLTNLTSLRLRDNPITDTSPLASLIKLVDVDVEITAPLPDPLPEDPLPPSEPEPEPETPAPSTIAAGQITFSELMYATKGGLFSQPQWIELYNNAPIDTEPVNLRGSKLVIEARDGETRHRYSVIEFEDLYIAPNWTVLLVTRGNSRDSGYLSEDRVYDLNDHSNVSSLGLRENAVLPASGFSLKLFAADGTLVDTAGNLDGVKRSKDTPAWELPLGWTEDRARTSLIRRYEAGVALPGTETMSWVRAADVQLATHTYYGRETDVGTPGYRRGGPLPVELSRFRSEQTDAGVIIEWTTESETDNAGFNILRSQMKKGSFVKVNPTLIQGAGTTAERTNYTWTDTTAKPNVAYYYQIEDVSFSGDRQRLATVRMRGYISASDKLTAIWGELKVQD